MLINYTQGTSISPKDVAEKVGRYVDHGDNNATDRQIADAFSLNVDGCCSPITGPCASHQRELACRSGNRHDEPRHPEGTTLYVEDPWDGALQESFNTLTQIYENMDNKTEFWIVHP
jgi:hypothetical protein